jgi:hypothetical protein
VRRLLVIAAGVIGGYLLVLLLLGWVLGGCVKDRVQERLAASLDAEVDIGDVSVGLIRGTIEIRDLHIHRERGGDLDIRIDAVDADVAALGWVLFDRDPDRVEVRGVTMVVSGRGALAMRDPDLEPMHIGELVVEDARISLSPTLLLPTLGKVDIVVDRARTGGFTMHSGVSWVFALRELAARAELPGGLSGTVSYANSRLAVGTGLGPAALEVAFEMPRPDPEQLEIAQLGELARALGRALLEGAARDWLEDRAKEKVKDLLR